MSNLEREHKRRGILVHEKGGTYFYPSENSCIECYPYLHSTSYLSKVIDRGTSPDGLTGFDYVPEENMKLFPNCICLIRADGSLADVVNEVNKRRKKICRN